MEGRLFVLHPDQIADPHSNSESQDSASVDVCGPEKLSLLV